MRRLSTRSRFLATIASLIETCKLNTVDPQACQATTSPPSVTKRVRSMRFCDETIQARCDQNTAYDHVAGVPSRMMLLETSAAASCSNFTAVLVRSGVHLSLSDITPIE